MPLKAWELRAGFHSLLHLSFGFLMGLWGFVLFYNNSSQLQTRWQLAEMVFLQKSAHHSLCTIFITLVHLTLNKSAALLWSSALQLNSDFSFSSDTCWGFPGTRGWFCVWHLTTTQATCIHSFTLARWIKKKGWKKNCPKYLSQNFTAVFLSTHRIKLCAIPFSCSL